MKLRVAIVAAVLTILVTRVAHGTAQLVTLNPGGGVLNVPGGPRVPMTAIGSGLRKKTIRFVTFRVYTARFLVSTADAAAFERRPARALASLDSIPAVAMHLVFERSVSPGQLGDSLDAAMQPADGGLRGLRDEILETRPGR